MEDSSRLLRDVAAFADAGGNPVPSELVVPLVTWMRTTRAQQLAAARSDAARLVSLPLEWREETEWRSFATSGGVRAVVMAVGDGWSYAVRTPTGAVVADGLEGSPEAAKAAVETMLA